MTYEKPTPEDLDSFMNHGDPSDPALQTAIDLACVDMDRLLESAFRSVPQVMYAQFVLEIAHAYFKRSHTVSGDSQFAFEGGQPIWEPKDVLNRVRPQLAHYISPFPLPRDEQSRDYEWLI